MPAQCGAVGGLLLVLLAVAVVVVIYFEVFIIFYFEVFIYLFSIFLDFRCFYKYKF